jgi:Domain of unknown function (DUF3331)
MKMRKEKLDPLLWAGIIAGLCPSTSCAESLARTHAPDLARAHGLAIEPAAITVRVVDMPSRDTVMVEWGDSTSGRYGHQLWRLSRASKPGRCAISAAPIVKGDDIYRPPQGRYRPRNAAAIISALVVRRILLEGLASR